MPLTKEKGALVAALKAAARTASSRPLGLHFTKSPLYMDAFHLCSSCIKTVVDWEGTPEDLAAFVSERIPEIASAAQKAEDFHAQTPVDSSSVIGHTSGVPNIGVDGMTACHECGVSVGTGDLPTSDGPVFLVHETSSKDILLFVAHNSCWKKLCDNADKLDEDRRHREPSMAGQGLRPQQGAAINDARPRVEALRVMARDEWLLVLSAKIVLSS